MSNAVYNKIKKQKGERFARTLRDHHNGLLEIRDIERIVRHAGREDAQQLLPYLMTLLATNDNTGPEQKPEDPFVLLERAGYTAFYADTLDKQNSIERYFKKGELLCTFNDHARYRNYHIVHAVRKDADHLNRADFEGKEQREDEYGTSVISIQMLKNGGFIKITNRYNHAVRGGDNTFGSNPDNIIDGLTNSLKKHFNVEFSENNSPLPDDYTVIDDQIFKYNFEYNNIYYGDQAWATNGKIHEVNKDRYAMFDRFLFDNKTKTFETMDSDYKNSFADDFNRFYGQNKALNLKNGNLYLGDEMLIGAENSKITSLTLNAFTEMRDNCLLTVPYLKKFEAESLTTIGQFCLNDIRNLTNFDAPALTTIGQLCLSDAPNLTRFKASALITMGNYCLRNAPNLTCFEAPTLTTMGSNCFTYAHKLTCFEAPALTTMGDHCLSDVRNLTHFVAQSLKAMDDFCLSIARNLTRFEAPALTTMGDFCLGDARNLTRFEASALTTMGHCCLQNAPNLTRFEAPTLTTIGDFCLQDVRNLTCFEASALTTMGHSCLENSPKHVRLACGLEKPPNIFKNTPGI